MDSIKAGRGGPEVHADPHMLIGGSLQQNRLLGARIDWLSCTVSGRDAGHLKAVTDYARKGYPSDGFARSELRSCPLGDVWRRWHPHQESRAFGTDYETWEYPGPQAAHGVEQCRDLDTKPSRIDVAFDFLCHDDETPEDFVRAARPAFERLRMKARISGEAFGGTATWYIGSRSSERMVRIYRKDLDEESWAATHGPTLRVELVLKDERAAGWWEVYQGGTLQDGFAAAAAHLQRITGMQVAEDVGDIPEVLVQPALNEAEGVHQFIDQYGGLLVALDNAGIDVMDLARRRMQNPTRMSQSRMNKKQRDLRRSGPLHVQQQVERMIDHKAAKRKNAVQKIPAVAV